MKNITVAVPDDVYRRGRVLAAQKGTSLSGLVRDYLESLSDSESEFERLKALQDEVIERVERRHAATGEVFSAKDNLSRDELHDRASLR